MFRENVRGFAQQKRRFGQTGGLRGELPPRTQEAFFLDARRIIGTGSGCAGLVSVERSMREAAQTADAAACADKKSPGGGAVRA